MGGKQELSRLVTVISWLDQARWYSPEEIIKNDIYQSLNSQQKILVHWLCFITDLQRPVEMVWGRGGIVFSGLVKDYSEHKLAIGDITTFIEEHQIAPPKGKKNRPFVYQEIPYSPRFDFEEEQIIRTLELLLDYDKSLTNFMFQFVNQYKDNPEGLLHIAHALDLLIYQLREVSIGKAGDLFKSRQEMEKHYRRWRRKTTQGHKRLWAALRDYVENKNYRSYIEDNFSWPARNFELNQLELPGDVWNERFSKSLLYKAAKAADIKIKGRRNPISAPALARKIYDSIKGTYPDFYPAQLDVSFDFAPRMCDKQLCFICPFGQNGSLSVCNENPNKFCPVLLTTCGYMLNCNPNGCPIKGDIGCGLCSRNQDMKVEP